MTLCHTYKPHKPYNCCVNLIFHNCLEQFFLYLSGCFMLLQFEILLCISSYFPPFPPISFLFTNITVLLGIFFFQMKLNQLYQFMNINGDPFCEKQSPCNYLKNLNFFFREWLNLALKIKPCTSYNLRFNTVHNYLISFLSLNNHLSLLFSYRKFYLKLKHNFTCV